VVVWWAQSYKDATLRPAVGWTQAYREAHWRDFAKILQQKNKFLKYLHLSLRY